MSPPIAFIFTAPAWHDYFVGFGGVFLVGMTLGAIIKFFRAGS